ncbi:HEAT repeat domain-containing protein [Nitrospira sp. NS4]|uniref:HEAT repeat domain-containing protein n=1 Tax=Nitrospira sp. NS4 TaxID=3414498 RepID=UPI003C2F2873
MKRIHVTSTGRVWGSAIMLVGSFFAWSAPDISYARKELLTQEEKDRQIRTELIHLETLALTSHGPIQAAGLTQAAARRLEQLGYRTVVDPAQPHDVTVKVKCEELKTWEGTERSGGDADMVDAAARLWKGPACQILYRFGARWAEWRHEVRTDFATPQEAARKAGQADAGAYAIAQLIERLQTDPFPFLLAAEWGQSARLVATLDAAGTTAPQKQIVVGLLGAMQAVDAIPRLTAALTDPDPGLTQAAATALGTIGHEESIPPLLHLFNSGTPEQHRAAALGLGRLAPLHPNSDIVPTFLSALPNEPVPMQTILVRALGKTTDRRVLEPLRALHRSVLKQVRSDSTPELKELLTALGIALDGFDGVHTEE